MFKVDIGLVWWSPSLARIDALRQVPQAEMLLQYGANLRSFSVKQVVLSYCCAVITRALFLSKAIRSSTFHESNNKTTNKQLLLQ
jgi:hypothetical protein